MLEYLMFVAVFSGWMYLRQRRQRPEYVALQVVDRSPSRARMLWIPFPNRVDETRWALTDHGLAEKAQYYYRDLVRDKDDATKRRERAWNYRLLLETMLPYETRALLHECAATINEISMAELDWLLGGSPDVIMAQRRSLHSQLSHIARSLDSAGYHVEWYLPDLLVLYVERDSVRLATTLASLQHSRSTNGGFGALSSVATQLIKQLSQA